HGMPAEYRVAVFLISDPQRSVKVRIHGEDPRDLLGLIEAATPLAFGVELLQRDDVRITTLDDVRNALVAQPPIGAPAAVHVVSHDPHGGDYACAAACGGSVRSWSG